MSTFQIASRQWRYPEPILGIGKEYTPELT